MRAEDVTDTLNMALTASGCDQAHVHHKPRLLSDNGPSYIASELADYIEAQAMSHVRGAPMHPQTQGKIERWHQILKIRILLENYFLPGDLEAQIGAFVEHYNHRRFHESQANVTPADAYFGRAEVMLAIGAVAGIEGVELADGQQGLGGKGSAGFGDAGGQHDNAATMGTAQLVIGGRMQAVRCATLTFGRESSTGRIRNAPWNMR